MMNMIREGRGKPLLLVHGLGGSWRSWSTIRPALAEHREVLAIDLPGHGETPAEADSDTFAGLTNSVAAFLAEQGLGWQVFMTRMSAGLSRCFMHRRSGRGQLMS